MEAFSEDIAREWCKRFKYGNRSVEKQLAGSKRQTYIAANRESHIKKLIIAQLVQKFNFKIRRNLLK